MCGPYRRFTPLLPRTLRRIPQAVSTVATLNALQLSPSMIRVSIPQAVSTVATGVCKYAELHSRHCKVSIPQAVRSTVATSHTAGLRD